MAEPAAHTGRSRPTVYLHIGTPKSGTTYVQNRFAVNHERAAARGLLWPGPSWGRHVAAVRDLRQVADGQSPAPDGPWCALAAEAASWQGESVLISMEWLASLTPHQVEVAAASLQPARVEVICTARDLLRSFAAQGQEMTKNYRPWTWEDLVDQVLHDKAGKAQRTFWRQQDVPRIFERWLRVVPAEQVHLVTVPPAGGDREVLWKRFCAVLGIDGSEFEAPSSDNASLGVTSTMLMERLNQAAWARRLPPAVAKRVLHKAVAVDILTAHRSQEQPIALSEEMDGLLRRRADRMVAELTTFGVQLEGEWEDLLPEAPLHGRPPEDVGDSELLELCTDALVTLAVSTSEEIDRLRDEVSSLQRELAAELSRGTVRRAGQRALGKARRGVRLAGSRHQAD